ncbi:SGNH/GDSL hydrolase family protein [Leifsonia sp. SIMBA_070]|uniref:SGNH/GDSL hydrolase family protein n=1 Tax=Leifsonia sp. SIMBA_070 TaxID=3085810 RepID=UPI00397A6517
MTTRRSPLAHVAALLTAGLAAASLVGCMAAGQAAPTAEPVPVPSPTETPRPVVAAAIGDSIAIGNGVPAEDAWPLLVAQRFGWTLSDFGESAAGFTVEGLNTHTFDDQVSAVIRIHPDVVLVGATRNDLFATTATLKTAATAALQRLRTALPDARIIGVSALWGSDDAPAQVPIISATVRDAVLDVGGSWVGLGQPFAGRTDLVLADHVHPTVAGQRLLATTIANSIAAQRFQR